ncbi:MAG: CDP-diacylglycerol---glycerol-3-phosphate 3-phosphatidyltransferase [Frankiaceae bacterium]|jgi:CDP-diacylglycerol--glycerol-3-phosphate 3-phosphatidyltransferase|nr:CDP-diacylglycerol---glycerol-3-phosphate 3-phosphatidyltransferase [Frankiaceae bacterium]
MLSFHVRVPLRRILDPAGRFLHRHGVSPDMVTLFGTAGVATGALAYYPHGAFFGGSFFITCFIFNDMLDGAVARARGGGGRWGAFLDSSLDRVGDAAIFAGLAIYYIRHADVLLGSLVLFCLISGSLVSYVKARAEGLGMTCNVGFAERPERLLIVLITTGLSGLFNAPWIHITGLWVLAAASVVTIGQRLVEVRRQSRTVPVPEPATGEPPR